MNNTFQLYTNILLRFEYCNERNNQHYVHTHGMNIFLVGLKIMTTNSKNRSYMAEFYIFQHGTNMSIFTLHYSNLPTNVWPAIL